MILLAANTINCVGFLFFFTCQNPTPPQTTNVVCPPLIEIDAGTQKRTAAELRALPPGSALRAFVARSIEQRDVVKACKDFKKKPKG